MNKLIWASIAMQLITLYLIIDTRLELVANADQTYVTLDTIMFHLQTQAILEGDYR